MRLRFLETVASDRDGYPFMAGQMINLPRLDDRARLWIQRGLVQVLPDEPEYAIVGPPERAVTMRKRGRPRGARPSS